MRAWIRALLLAALLGAAAGACGRQAGITAPEGGAVMDGATPPDSSGGTHADSTGRWGGFIGSGG